MEWKSSKKNSELMLFSPQFRQSAHLPAQSRHPSCPTHCTEPSLLWGYFFQQQVSLGTDQRAPHSHPAPLALQLRLAQQGPVIATQSKEKEHKTGAKRQAQRPVRGHQGLGSGRVGSGVLRGGERLHASTTGDTRPLSLVTPRSVATKSEPSGRLWTSANRNDQRVSAKHRALCASR